MGNFWIVPPLLSVNNMFFIHHSLKFEYQPSWMKVKTTAVLSLQE
jgi:hypothetical protein